MKHAIAHLLIIALIVTASVVPLHAHPLASANRTPDEDRALLNQLQRDTLEFFWSGSYPETGLAHERTDTAHLGAVGGTGFGAAALVVGVDRGWIKRADAVERLNKITEFLINFKERKELHGAFPHWINGATGAIVPFAEDDFGADLVETAFLMQGLLTARAYFTQNTEDEHILRNQITELWEAVDWNWFTNGNKGGLYWHWSPKSGFSKGMMVRGNNEALITYVLALGSPTHPIPEHALREWYSSDDSKAKEFFGYRLEASLPQSGPMFTAHYSFLGLDPRALSDHTVPGGYFERNTTQALINRAYCLYVADSTAKYHEGFWGLTSSETPQGYKYSSPGYESATVAPTAALASMPYLPEYAMRVLWDLKVNHPEMQGPYGPYDAFSLRDNWHSTVTLAIDQLPICCMVENYRTGLLWKLFMSIPEIQKALARGSFKETAANDDFRIVPALTGLPRDGGAPTPTLCDLRRHPDSGRYWIDYAASAAGVAHFTVRAMQGPTMLASWSESTLPGRHRSLFPAYLKPCNDIYMLTLDLNGQSRTIPIRLN